MMRTIKKFSAAILSIALCVGSFAAPAFAYSSEVDEPVQPVIVEDTEEPVSVTSEESGPLTPEGNLTLVDDYHTTYSDGSGQQFITLVSKSGNYFYLVIDRDADGDQTVHFMNLVDEADLLTLMEEDAADAYNAEKEAEIKAELERQQAEEEARKAAEGAANQKDEDSGDKLTKLAATFLGVVALLALAAGGGFYFYLQQKKKKQAEQEALDPDLDYTEDRGDFEVPEQDEDEADEEELDTEPV